jgi:1,4-alpha-glucan branching enzyme
MTPSQTLPGASTPSLLPQPPCQGVPSHHHRQFEVMGAQHCAEGTTFTVWAPNARSVAVVGSFNGWQPQPLQLLRDGSGRWSGGVTGPKPGDQYKYRIEDASGGWQDKADPYALRCEHPPGTASEIWDLAYDWSDQGWMAGRAATQSHASAISIYEVHLASSSTTASWRCGWRRIARRWASPTSS